MSEQPVGSIPQWTQGDRLRKALDHAGMKVGEMSEYLGIDRNTAGNYMADRTRVPGPVLRLWAMRTGVPMGWIVTGDTKERPKGPGGGGAPAAAEFTSPTEPYMPPLAAVA